MSRSVLWVCSGHVTHSCRPIEKVPESFEFFPKTLIDIWLPWEGPFDSCTMPDTCHKGDRKIRHRSTLPLHTYKQTQVR